MRVTTILHALPGIGAATARRLMHETAISEALRARGLTAAQRERLLATTAEPAPGRRT
jgi:ribosomal protein S13